MAKNTGKSEKVLKGRSRIPAATTSPKGVKIPSKSKNATHATHSMQVVRLNRVLGQIQGIQRMIGDERYCNDILIQLRAAVSALKSVELQVLKTHMRHCVVQAIDSKDPQSSNKKVEELIALLERY